MDRLIFHIDVNSAFLSWEAAKRVAEGRPDLRLVPSAIGGDRDKRTGVILAKSIPAKKYGVTTGEPVSMALRKCPQLILAKPDFGLYVRNSAAFMDICREYAPIVEKFSIDECFLDMTGTQKLYPDPVKTAHEIKDRIRRELGFTVNVGIAENKLCAKMASDFEKPDRVHTLFPREIPEKLWPLPVGDLFSVGSATAQKLCAAGLCTVGALAHADPAYVKRLLGTKGGEHLCRYARGVDDSPVSAGKEEAKGYNISTTLEENVTDAQTAHRILLALADSVAARMRADQARAYCVGISIRSSDFRNKSHQRRLPDATDVTDEIYGIAARLFDELWDQRMPLRLLGISLTNITRDSFEQSTLFPDEKRERARKLDRALDSIRGKYGTDAVFRAGTCGVKRTGEKYRAESENSLLTNRKIDDTI